MPLPRHVQLFVGAEHIWALDSHFQPLLVIPAAEITSRECAAKKGSLDFAGSLVR